MSRRNRHRPGGPITGGVGGAIVHRLTSDNRVGIICRCGCGVSINCLTRAISVNCHSPRLFAVGEHEFFNAIGLQLNGLTIGRRIKSRLNGSVARGRIALDYDNRNRLGILLSGGIVRDSIATIDIGTCRIAKKLDISTRGIEVRKQPANTVHLGGVIGSFAILCDSS